VPFFVFYLTDKIMLLRPGGYGETELLEGSPFYSEYKDKKHYVRALLICLPFILIGFLPLIFQHTGLPEMVGLQKDYDFSELGINLFAGEKFFDFKETATGFVGPFGIGALFMGMFIPLGLTLFFIISYRNRTKNLIKARKKTKQLEQEFNSSLFQLGNRIGNGMPPELVFGKVAESSKGLMTEDFFRRVNHNIRQGGMSVEKAIFNPKNGAIVLYPSSIIATSMRILVESTKKGLKIAAIGLMSISEYVKNMQRITNRLRDMLAEIISDMKSNMTFLAPLLSGIVVGLAVMITSILNKLNVTDLAGGDVGIGGLGNILNIFDLTKMIPPYFLQIIIGIYIIEIVFILTGTLVTINSGEDKLERTHEVWQNLKKGIFLYLVTALFATLALFLLSSIVLGNLG
jgi:hypothetical protein